MSGESAGISPATADSDEALVVLGRISGLYGVQGWVKIYSFTEPRKNILDYRSWHVRQGAGAWRQERLEQGRVQGKGVVAKLVGCDDRDRAVELLESEIAVPRAQLPRLGSGSYYWVDLIGLRVETLAGVDLGRIDHLFETGANDVIVAVGERERLIPYLRDQVVKEVDLAAGRMLVDWDPEF